ncbi:MAG: lysozyme inhibitor LprI family protein, partial [Terracidiphilus sp.]
ANLRGTSPKEKALDGPIVLQALENAAKKLEDSQVSWRSYRDQYCDAVRLSFTTGSGAGTAMEECLYRTALARVRQLRLDFPDPAVQKGHPD